VAVFLTCYEILNLRHLIWRELVWHVLRTGRAVVQFTLLLASLGIVPRGVKKVERALCPMNSEVAWVDVIRFSVEFERRQNGTGNK